jgi:hypothetical protein
VISTINEAGEWPKSLSEVNNDCSKLEVRSYKNAATTTQLHCACDKDSRKNVYKKDLREENLKCTWRRRVWIQK